MAEAKKAAKPAPPVGPVINSNWPWLVQPIKNSPTEITSIQQNLLQSEEILTEMDFADKWEIRAFSGIAFLNGEKQIVDSPSSGTNTIEVNYKELFFRIPEFVATLYSIDPKIDAKSLRFTALHPDFKREKAQLVMISIWDGDGPQSQRKIMNIYIIIETTEQAVLFVNAMSRLVYEANEKEALRCHSFTLMMTGPVYVIRCTPAERDKFDQKRKAMKEAALKAAGGVGVLETDAAHLKDFKLPAQKEMWFVLDEESLGIYEDEFSPRPVVDFRFYKDDTELSIESIYCHNDTGQLEIQQGAKTVCYIYDVLGSEPMAEMYYHMSRKFKEKDILPKSQDVFTDMEKFFKCFDPAVIAARELEKEKAKAEEKARAKLQNESRTAPKDSPPWFDQLLHGKHLENADEEMTMSWFGIEHRIEQIIRDGTDPPAIYDGKLDPKSMDDLHRWVKEIKDEMLSERYEHVVSQLQGGRNHFDGSLLSEIKETNNLDIIKRIYFMSIP